MLAKGENHQRLCHERGHGGEGIEVGLCIIGEGGECPSCEACAEEYARCQERNEFSGKRAWSDGGRIGLKSSFPHHDAVDHCEEIIGIDGDLSVEPLFPAEPGIGDHLGKAEKVGEDIGL